MSANDSANGWSSKTLHDLATINYGKSPKDILAIGGQYPVVGTGGTERYGNGFLYDGESVVLGRKGTIDRVYFATGRFWTIDTAYYLSDFNDTLPRWLFYFLQNIDLRQLNEATGVPSLSRDRLYQIEIEKPPQCEQSKIAEILSTVDRAIEQTEALIAKQQRIKTGLMQNLLTRGIDEQGNLRSEETHQFKDSPLGRIPVEWDVESFANACERVSVGIATSTTKHFRTSGIPLLRNQNVLNGRFDLTDLLFISPDFDSVNKSKRLREGDLITMRTGYPGRTAIATKMMVGWQTFTTLISSPKKTDYLPEFLALQLNSFVGRKQIVTLQGGGAQQNLNVGWIVNMRVLRVPIAEQEQIVKLFSSCEQDIDTTASNLRKMRSLKIALMQDLLTGEKRVTPLLEPAVTS